MGTSPEHERLFRRTNFETSFVLAILAVSLTAIKGDQLTRLTDFARNPEGPEIREAVDVNGTLFFTARDSFHGAELWKSDGTISGTVPVKDIIPGPNGSSPQNLVNVNGTLFFGASDPEGNRGLWKSGGTSESTVLIKAIGPLNSASFNGALFFAAYDEGISGLWTSDGTGVGTVRVKTMSFYLAGNGSTPFFRDVNGALLFTGHRSNGLTLWRSDGTEAGTILLPGVTMSFDAAFSAVIANRTAFFNGRDASSGSTGLWKSDGTAAGTMLVKDGVAPSEMVNVNGTLFFSSGGSQLWKSDGTTAGTVLLKDLYAQILVNMDGTLFFVGTNPDCACFELWKSDGTPEGTALVKDINSQGSSNPYSLIDWKGVLFFVADDGIHGHELWRSDGTERGSVLVKDMNPGRAGSNSRHLANVNGTLFFTADDGVHGIQLWKYAAESSAAGRPIAQQSYLKASNTGANDWFGAAAEISGDTIVISASRESSNARGINADQTDNSAPNCGAAYVFVRSGTNWVQQAYLKASNAEAGDVFGWSVAISGDTIVVGAPGEDSAATGVDGEESDNSLAQPGDDGAGAAYIFVRKGTNWTQQAYLKASNTGFDAFGAGVAISGDTVAVVAPGESSAATGVNGDQNNESAAFAGAVYVFVRNGTNWTQQAYVKASNTSAEDVFGSCVAISGDTLVVGALQEDSHATGVNGDESNNSATDSGAAYVFARHGTNWSQQAYFKASNTGAGDLFGVWAAISGDTIAIAAPREDSNGTGVNGDQNNNRALNSGAVYVFQRSGTNWAQQAYLKSSNNSAGDAFGETFALEGDLLIVGAEGEDSSATGVNGVQNSSGATDSGAAYVFTRSGTNWSQQAYLKASNTGAGDSFGPIVSISGSSLLITAPFEDSNATGINGNQGNNSTPNSGAAYVFTGLEPSGPQLGLEQFGNSLRFAWPLSAANFVLDEADHLNAQSPTVWTQVPFLYQTNATHISITLPPTAEKKFYRLRKP